MGCGDSVPVIPNVIQDDPDMADPTIVSVSKMGWSRDYAIYRGSSLPASKEDKVQKMWLWFNKSDSDSNRVKIELENFNRGHKENKDAGEVLWGAEFTDRPRFEYQQKVKGAAWTVNPFRGFSNDPYDSDGDDYYCNHKRHCGSSHNGNFQGTIITKWQLNTAAVLYGGDTARTASMNGEKMKLLIYSKGTVVTSYYEEEYVDDEGHRHKRTNKNESEFIDRIEYKIEFRGQITHQWVEAGDKNHDDTASTGDYAVRNPLYSITYHGGFFKSSFVTIETLVGVDPALAMLIGHLVSTEYSNAAIKNDLKVNTPRDFPNQMNFFNKW